MDNNQILDPSRSIMKVYAAREYKDDTYRSTNEVEVNLPEHNPTTPMDDKSTKFILPKSRDYFENINFPETEDFLTVSHCTKFPIMAGTLCPVRFNKGAEFLLIYPTGKIDEGRIVFICDVEPKRGGQ